MPNREHREVGSAIGSPTRGCPGTRPPPPTPPQALLLLYCKVTSEIIATTTSSCTWLKTHSSCCGHRRLAKILFSINVFSSMLCSCCMEVGRFDRKQIVGSGRSYTPDRSNSRVKSCQPLAVQIQNATTMKLQSLVLLKLTCWQVAGCFFRISDRRVAWGSKLSA